MKEVKDKMYLVKYTTGDMSGYKQNILFVTSDESTATKYVTKFNKILKKWKDYFKQFETDEDDDMGANWIKDEFEEKHFYRWYKINNIIECYYEEIEVR